jgi:glutamyl-tRNA synthetase
MANPPRPTEVTRLAPSPTGALHLGNARTFLVNWALARQNGWCIVLRIEDLDGPRVKEWASQQAIEILTWLGIDYDEGPLYQANDTSPYVDAMKRLVEAKRAFACDLSRREIEEALSAPHGGEVRYDPSLRPDKPTPPFDPAADTNWRLKTADARVRFDDAFQGPIETNPAREIGDFVIWTKAGVPAYQLAVVVDDARQGVTQVVRGDDLLASTGRQLVLQQALGLSPTPSYTHLPLVVGPDGRRLAKRHGDTRLVTYREQGVRAERVVGLLACWCGVVESPREMTAEEFAKGLRLQDLPKRPMVMTAEDDAWLMGND